MEKDISTILAVNPGSRYVGLAVFKDDDLRDWRVSSLAGSSSEEKGNAFVSLLSDLIEMHGINTLVMKALHPARSSKTLRALVRRARGMAQTKNVRVHEISIDDVKRVLTPEGKSNKRRLMEEAASRYPFLLPAAESQKKSPNPYLIRMFEAVAVGLAYLTTLEGKS